MAFRHNNLRPLVLRRPIDPEARLWFYFNPELPEGHTVVSAAATVVNATLETDATLFASVVDTDGTEHTNVYGVEVSPTRASGSLSLTLTLTTTTGTNPDRGIRDEWTIVMPISNK